MKRNGQDAGVMAFEGLCKVIEAPLYSYLLRLTGNRSDAEELAQEALFRLFQALRRGSLNQSSRSYVFAIAHNLAMDHHRAARARMESPAFSSGNRIIPLYPQAASHPSMCTERHLLRNELDKALNDLPRDQRAALLLREFGELSYQEISQTLGVPLAQVKIWLYRGRKRLAQLLDRDGQYIGNHHHVT